MALWAVCYSYLPAQKNIDSLEQAIATATNDSVAIERYGQLMALLLRTNQMTRLDSIADASITLSRKFKHADGLQNALYYKVIALDELGKGETSFPYIDEAIRACFESGDSLSAARHFVNRGILNHRSGKWDEALKNYFDAYEIYNHYGEKQSLSRTLNNIAIIYRSQGQYEESIEFYNQSLDLKKALGDSKGLANTYQNLGLLYSYTGQMESAIDNLILALEYFEKLGFESDIAHCYSALGTIYLNLGCYEEAQGPLDKAQAYYRNNPEPVKAAYTLFSLGSLAYAYGKLEEAERYLVESLQYSRQAGQQKNANEIYLKLAAVQSELGNYQQAFQAMDKAYLLQDSLKEDKRLELMEEMQAKFDVVEKEKELVLNELALGKRTRQRNGLLAVLATLLLLGGLIVFLLRQRVRISRQETELQKQRVRQLEQEKKLTALSALMEGEEKERLRIAADLHDGLGGLLTSVKAHFSHLPVGNGHQSVYKKTDQLINDACVEVRRISHNMLPRSLAFSGLKGAAEDLALDLQQQGLDCKLEIIGLKEEKLKDKALPIYRILQELLNNIVKHAQASYIYVQIFQKEGTLFLMVEDDGKGFDLEDARQNGGIGLNNIESRVKVMGGEVEWDSIPGEGTSVNVRIPLVVCQVLIYGLNGSEF